MYWPYSLLLALPAAVTDAKGTAAGNSQKRSYTTLVDRQTETGYKCIQPMRYRNKVKRVADILEKLGVGGMMVYFVMSMTHYGLP